MIGGLPVITLSGRGHWLDKVLFALLHELVRVVRKHIAVGVVLGEYGTRSTIHEVEANELAPEWPIPG
jgi:HTH-type transcriptional regulator/antitoxin HigA